MSKFTETTYGNKHEILKFPDHYVNLAVTVDDAGIATNSEGKKIIPAGTILGGGVLSNPDAKAKKAVTTGGASDAEGILFNDVDLTYGPASGAMLIHGFIDLAKIPAAPTAEEITALKHIMFLK